MKNLVFFIAFTAVVIAGLEPITAQTDIAESDLASASAGRTIRIGAVADGHVTVLPLEVYVARVLAAEGDPKDADAAQQALAIAIRTYTLKNTGRHARDGFDLCDSTHCQVLRPSTPTSRRAAIATTGQVLTFHGDLAEVFYSASCGGRSERAGDVWPGADYPYLVSRPDDVCEGDPEWVVDFPLETIRRALARVGFEGVRLTDVEVDGRTSSGRVARLHLTGLRPNVIAGDQFRQALGATEHRTTAFRLEKHGDQLRFTGRGYGHGVGMCAIGAARRALRGESARAILAQYYPGLDITPLSGSVVPADTTATVAPVPPIASVRDSGITVTVPRNSSVDAVDIERVATAAHGALSRRLGTSALPLTIRLHDTLDSFRLATNRPWWVSEVADSHSIDLAPAAVLAQRGGVAESVRVGIAELLVAGSLADRPAWVRIGAARYFAREREGAAPASAKTQCPSDAELLLAVSAAAQREAEARAEACFARGLAATNDWRAVR
jgi:stage II sporulation protein D